jgi:hypothetical protein
MGGLHSQRLQEATTGGAYAAGRSQSLRRRLLLRVVGQAQTMSTARGEEPISVGLRRDSWLAVFAAIVLSLLAIGVAASMAEARAKSIVTVARHGRPIHGHVSSPRRACERHRRVTLHHSGDTDHVRTFRHGGWYIPVAPIEAGVGKWWASVKATSKCKGDRSRPHRVSAS